MRLSLDVGDDDAPNEHFAMLAPIRYQREEIV